MVKRLVYGVGVNDADYVVDRKNPDGSRRSCPFYYRWMCMLGRCYSEKLHEKQPTYVGCYVCDEWLTFSNFKSWMEQQDWQGNCLDKDLLAKGNKVYSPETCVFVSQEVNKILGDSNSARGEWPIGVCWFKRDSNFVAQIKLKNKTKYLGNFPTPLQAHASWQKAKAAEIERVASTQSEVVKNALMLRYHQLQADLVNGAETIKL